MITNQPAALRAVPMGLFPTFDSLQAVVSYADSRLPLAHKNEIYSLLMIHQNTLLKILADEKTHSL